MARRRAPARAVLVQNIWYLSLDRFEHIHVWIDCARRDRDSACLSRRAELSIACPSIHRAIETNGRNVPIVESAWNDSPLRATLASQSRGEPSVAATLYVDDSPETGAKPLHFVGDDGRSYWTKWPGNPHGALSMAHEWIVSRLALSLAAPACEGVLIYVDSDLVQGLSIGGVQPRGGVWFGSRFVNGVESTRIERVSRDGNAQRVPAYLALWNLCLGCDEQFIYDQSSDSQVWSIDHGLWFDSHEGDWTPELLARAVERGWDQPDWSGSRRVDPRSLHEAATALEQLSSETIGDVVGNVPVEWKVSDEQLLALGEFIHNRRKPVAQLLRSAAARV